MLKPFVHEALQLTGDKSRPISALQYDLEDLIQRVYEKGKEDMLNIIKEDRRQKEEEELRKGPYL